MDHVERKQLLQEFAEIIEIKLEARRSVSEAQHKADHDFVNMLRDRDRRRLERWERIKTQLYAWAAVAAIGAIFTGFGLWVRDWLHK